VFAHPPPSQIVTTLFDIPGAPISANSFGEDVQTVALTTGSAAVVQPNEMKSKLKGFTSPAAMSLNRSGISNRESHLQNHADSVIFRLKACESVWISRDACIRFAV
jgi:hypothetical protein